MVNMTLSKGSAAASLRLLILSFWTQIKTASLPGKHSLPHSSVRGRAQFTWSFICKRTHHDDLMLNDTHRLSFSLSLSGYLSIRCILTYRNKHTLPSPHVPRLLCFCWQGAFVLLHGSAGVGTHYVICGVCLGYIEREMEQGVTTVTHTHDDIIH